MMTSSPTGHGGTAVSHTTQPPVLTVERVFDAPRELVFKAWTEADRLARWFGPQGWTLPVCTVDLRPGGVWQYCMRGPNGEESWGRAVYREIVPPQRLVYVDAFTDAQGNVIESMPQLRVTTEFVDQDGKTKLTSRSDFASADDLNAVLAMGVVQGMGETWDRLAAYLASDQ
jgi:uncharacterized protein YndB with AHSA1/START domain